MILRKAKLEDFEIFKQLYEDKENLYQFLYINSQNKNHSNELNQTFSIDENLIEFNYNFKQFKEDLNSSLLLYMIEDSKDVIGYISIFYCYNGKYKIAEWSMFNPNDENKKIEVIKCLKELKLPRLKRFSICTVSDEVVRFLLENNFYNSSCSFYCLEI